MSEWTKKKKGHATIHTHPELTNAVVDRKGFGMNPHITFKGIIFDTVKEAKEYALANK